MVNTKFCGPTKKQVLTVSIVLLLLFASLSTLQMIKPAYASGTLIASFTDMETGWSAISTFHPSGGASGSAAGANFSFTVGNYNITSVKFYLNVTGNPTANGTAILYAEGGSPNNPTSVLTTSNSINYSTLTPNTPAWVEFFFTGSNQYQITQNVNYTIALESTTVSGVLDSSNYVSVGIKYTGVGIFYAYDYNSWSGNGLAGDEMNFYLYGAANSTTVSLISPSNGATINANSTSFTYSPSSGLQIQNSSLWLNVSSTWQNVAWNSSEIIDDATNTIVYILPSYGTYVWNVEIFNATTGVFASSNYTLTFKGPTVYSENAIWIVDQSWVPIPNYANTPALSGNITQIAINCSQNNITMVFVFIGYWSPSTNNVTYVRTPAFYQNVISIFHTYGIKVLAWTEAYGSSQVMDITPANRGNMYASITTFLNIGFDGYNDAMESYSGTLQQFIDYENNCTVVVHNLGKIMTADIGIDWSQSINMYLKVDYIVTMFYGTMSGFELPSATAYWAENFGLYGRDHGAPASPVILGIMNDIIQGWNQYPLCWQLEQAAVDMNTITNRSLAGFCFYTYEYMNLNRTDDWVQWNYFINHLGQGLSTPTLYAISLNSSPAPTATVTFQGLAQTTNTLGFSFNVSSSYTLSAISAYVATTMYPTSLGISSTTVSTGGYYPFMYFNGPYTLNSSVTISLLGFYAGITGSVRLAIYNESTYVISGWGAGTNEHPYCLETYSSSTYCVANTWTQISVSTVTLPAGDYFIAASFDTNKILATYTSGSYSYYGRGQYITQAYGTAFNSTLSTVEGAVNFDFCSFAESSPTTLVPYSFSQWEDGSTSLSRTLSMANITSNGTFTASYIGSTYPSITIIYPLNTTYVATTIPINFTASGGTIDQMWWNIQYSNGSWVYAMNQTFTVATSVTLTVGSYTAYEYANNTLGNVGYSTVTFSVTSTIYSLLFDFRDLVSNEISSSVTWQLYNGTSLLSYTQGSVSLPDGTYTLNTYYKGSLIYVSTLPMSTYGNTTVTVYPTIHMITGGTGNICFNSTITMLGFDSVTASNITFHATGSSGPYAITIDVPQDPSVITKNGTVYTSWTYNAATMTVTITTATLSTWEIDFTSSVIIPPIIYTFTLTVEVTSQNQGVARVPITVSGQLPALTNQNGTATFTLSSSPYPYAVSITYQNVSQSKTVIMTSDQAVAFDVSQTQQTCMPLAEYALIGFFTFMIFVVLILVIIFLAKRRRYG